ncbi:hypothetical protein DIPPA_02152 [Diplonema papillatum]|nr:hypothetical protein DIPPA_02152 [Diplonema papillatum]
MEPAGAAGGTLRHIARTLAWIPFDAFLRLEREWHEGFCDAGQGVRKEQLVGGVVGSLKIDERAADALEKIAGPGAPIGLQEFLRGYFPEAPRWEVRRFFCQAEVPDEQLLILKGSLGQASVTRYLPKESKYFTSTFDYITQNTVGKLSLAQLLATGEVLGNMRCTMDQFLTAAFKANISANEYRATFWELLPVLFPRLHPEVVARYEAPCVLPSDVSAFAGCFTGTTHITLDEEPTCLTISNGLTVDDKSLKLLDRDKNGKVSLYELVQSFHPNIPPLNVKRAILGHAVAAKKQQTNQREAKKRDSLRRPVLELLARVRDGDCVLARSTVASESTTDADPLQLATASTPMRDLSSDVVNGLVRMASMARGMTSTPVKLPRVAPRPASASSSVSTINSDPDVHRSDDGRECSMSTESEESIQKEDEVFTCTKHQLPSLRLLDLMYRDSKSKTKKGQQSFHPLTITRTPPPIPPNPPPGGRGKKPAAKKAMSKTSIQVSQPPRLRRSEHRPPPLQMAISSSLQPPRSPTAELHLPAGFVPDRSQAKVDQARHNILQLTRRIEEETPQFHSEDFCASNDALDKYFEQDTLFTYCTAPPQPKAAAGVRPSKGQGKGVKKKKKTKKSEDPGLENIATRDEELAWFRCGTGLKPELKRAAAVVGTQMPPAKSSKVASFLSYDNADMYVSATGADVSVHCPPLASLLQSECQPEPVAKPKPRRRPPSRQPARPKVAAYKNPKPQGDDTRRTASPTTQAQAQKPDEGDVSAAQSAGKKAAASSPVRNHVRFGTEDIK